MVWSPPCKAHRQEPGAGLQFLSLAFNRIVEKSVSTWKVHFGGKAMYGLALVGALEGWSIQHLIGSVSEVINGLALIVATLLPDMPTASAYLAAMACGLQYLNKNSKLDRSINDGNNMGVFIKECHVHFALWRSCCVLSLILLWNSCSCLQINYRCNTWVSGAMVFLRFGQHTWPGLWQVRRSLVTWNFGPLVTWIFWSLVTWNVGRSNS